MLARWRVDGEWSPVQVVADGPAFQARARLASDGAGGVYAVWEEGPRAWGETYRSVVGTWNNATDARGPLHRFSELRAMSGR